MYQSFAVWLLRTRAQPRDLRPRDWLVAAVFYGVSAMGNLFVLAPPGVSVISDASGVQWPVSSILNSSTLISIFVMGAFSFLGCVRVLDVSQLTD